MTHRGRPWQRRAHLQLLLSAYSMLALSQEDNPDTRSTDSGSIGTGSPVSEMRVDTESMPPTPAALCVRLPIYQDQRSDHSCGMPDGRPAAPTIPLGTAQYQETPSGKGQVFSSHKPTTATQRSANDESPASDAHDEGRQRGAACPSLALCESLL